MKKKIDLQKLSLQCNYFICKKKSIKKKRVKKYRKLFFSIVTFNGRYGCCHTGDRFLR